MVVHVVFFFWKENIKFLGAGIRTQFSPYGPNPLMCMWSFDLRDQRNLIDGWLCFDYDLQIPSHKISKTSYIRYDMK